VIDAPALRVAAAVALYGALLLASGTDAARALVRRALPGLGALGYALARAIAAAAGLLALVGWALLLEDRGIYALGEPWRWALRGGQAFGVLVAALALKADATREAAGGAAGGGARVSAHDGDGPEAGEDVEGGDGGIEDGAAAMAAWVRGPYARVRHPATSGALLFLWLTPQMTANRLAFAAAATLVLLVGAVQDDRRRQARLGPAYRAYRRDVPAFVPRPG